MSKMTLTVNGRPHDRRRRSGDAAALRAQRRSAAAGSEVRLRTRPVRRLHGHRQGAGDPLVRHAGVGVAGADITTLEGLGTLEKPHPIQQAFIDEQAAQCGFCLNGVILTAKALLDRNPKATDAEIQQAMSGVLCRCFAHTPHAAGHQTLRAGRSRMKTPSHDARRTAALDRGRVSRAIS